MTTTVQPRHVKLAFAGREKNWAFAAYEVKQLGDAFDRLSVQWPQWRQQRIVELVETIVRDPLFEMDIAIKDKNEAMFAESYKHLTEACNACHFTALEQHERPRRRCALRMCSTAPRLVDIVLGRHRAGAIDRSPRRARAVSFNPHRHSIMKLGFLVLSIALLALPAVAQTQSTDRLQKSQADALNAYDTAVNAFRSILRERRAQLDTRQQLPNLPGQALYLARNNMMSAYRDVTAVVASRIGRPNKFGIPPAYFDADNEPLLDEYLNLFAVMQAPPVGAQNSDTPFRDIVDLGTAIARARGLDAATAEVAGRISLGLFFAETNGNQNMGNARSNTYKGSFQTGVSEDKNGQKKWAAVKKSIAALDPALSARDDMEEARIGSADHRFNHWTAVRDALMNAHIEHFPQIPMIAKALPDPIDQMKVFELIQIIPSPTKSALNSGSLAGYRISDLTIMGYLRNNSIFTFGQADRAKTSATFREILDAMWLFNEKFERALSMFKEIKAQQKN